MSGLLLDTHVFLWFASDDKSLPELFRRLIKSEAGPVWISAASAWEIAIKFGLGKLVIDVPVNELLGTKMQKDHIGLLPISIQDAVDYSSLSFPDASHRDPFDRMLAVQAKSRDLTLVTLDKAFAAYDVKVLRL